MTIYTIPLDAVPNQSVTVTLEQKTWAITVETRLGNLYLSLTNTTDGTVILNRICRDRVMIEGNFFFYDTDGIGNPVFTGLGGRYVLAWWDGIIDA
jgi:hypothetical protein